MISVQLVFFEAYFIQLAAFIGLERSWLGSEFDFMIFLRSQLL